MTSLRTGHDLGNVHVNVQQRQKNTLSLQANASLAGCAAATKHTLLQCLAQVCMNAFETRTGLNVAVQHTGAICTGPQQGDAKKQLTSMRLNRRALWKVLVRSSPMTYLSLGHTCQSWSGTPGLGSLHSIIYKAFQTCQSMLSSSQIVYALTSTAYRADWRGESAMEAVVFHAFGLAMAAHMPLANRMHVKSSDTE